MKPICLCLLLSISILSHGQKKVADSIRRSLLQSTPDSSRVLLLVQLANSNLFYRPDSAAILSQESIRQSRELGFVKGEGRALNVLGTAFRLRGDLPQALETHIHALQISRKIGDRESEASSLVFIGVVYLQLSDFRQGMLYLRQAEKIRECPQNIKVLALSNLGDAYEKINRLDSALFFQRQAYSNVKPLPRGPLQSLILMRLGILQSRLGNDIAALRHYLAALENAYFTGDQLNRGRVEYCIAEVYYKVRRPDSSLKYARLSFETSRRALQKSTELNVSTLLVKLYRMNGSMDSAFRYQQEAMSIKDSLYGPEKFQQLQLLTLTEQRRQQELLLEQASSQSRFQRIGLICGLGVFLLIAILLWRNNRQQQKANLVLNKKNIQIQTQHKSLEATLVELRTTQFELVEKEKLASLYQQQLKIQQVRNKIASELHDDIGSTLSSIHLFSEGAKKEIRRDSHKALPMLERIDISSREIMQSISDIVWSIQSKNDDTAHLIDKIHSFASQLLSVRNIVFRLDCPVHFASVPLPMEFRRNIYLICKEVLNNIVKHARATEVDMEVVLDERNIHIGIRDNGHGFDPGKPSRGNGLLNLQDRAKEISGRLQIDSQPGKGTRIDLHCSLT